ncbi:hypothetical protein MPS_4610 [Mycobacterium pseudoshottsii JCM 15466]|nr:hypothetical protein MMSP_0503 [Mycobacterium sp. 012931]GAQ39277.1 hypothetical protein MPS_4610 [Mycobacterium pseudoshottsii JCM 15466]
MTEPQGGADPRVFTTRAVRDGDDWVISGGGPAIRLAQ